MAPTSLKRRCYGISVEEQLPRAAEPEVDPLSASLSVAGLALTALEAAARICLTFQLGSYPQPMS